MPGGGVVVIGGSAGGMQALRGIFGTLSDLRGAVMCVVLHRSPDESPLADVLQTYTDLVIGEPRDSPWTCSPETVTVAPAGYHMLLGRNRVLADASQTSVSPYATAPGVRAHLTLDQSVAYSRPSIDVTMISAADFTDSVIAVLLSCANEDGAAGCAAVAAAGGRVVLQDPVSCEAPVAVTAALRRVTPDHVADPAGIGVWLSDALRDRRR